MVYAGFSCMVIGNPGIGKTDLIHAYLKNKQMVPHEGRVVIDSYDTKIRYEGHKYDISIYDCTGEDDITKILCADIYIVCFSVDQPLSLQDLELSIVPLIKSYHSSFPLILVGTRSDLRKTSKDQENIVSREQALEMAQKLGCKKYFECSIHDRVSIDAVFNQAIRIIMKFDEPGVKMSAKKSSCSIL